MSSFQIRECRLRQLFWRDECYSDAIPQTADPKLILAIGALRQMFGAELLH